MNFIKRIPIFFFSALFPFKIYGKENIPEGKALLVSNHFHACDCGIIAKIYHKDIFFLAKKELFSKKIVSKLIKAYGGIPIDRDNPDISSLLSAIRVLRDGHKLALFPEGTRNKTGGTELQPIKGGAMVMAVKAKSPIVPIMIERKIRFLRRIRVIVGKPFELNEFYGVKLTDEVISQMEKIVYDKMVEQQTILTNMINSKKGVKNESNSR